MRISSTQKKFFKPEHKTVILKKQLKIRVKLMDIKKYYFVTLWITSLFIFSFAYSIEKVDPQSGNGEKINELIDEIVLIKQQQPYFRLTSNQTLRYKLIDGDPSRIKEIEGFTLFVPEDFQQNHEDPDDWQVKFEIYKTIKHNVKWEDRDYEEQEILKAMGKNNLIHILPEFHVIKMKWRNAIRHGGSRVFYQHVSYSGWITTASYARLNSGEIDGHYFSGITDKWNLCGVSYKTGIHAYTYTHPFVKSKFGEVLFTLPAALAGNFPLEKENPKWGYFPYFVSKD